MTRPAKVQRSPVAVMTSPFGLGGTTPMPALDDLTDVDISSPSDGDVPTWDSGTGTWIAGPGGGFPVDDTSIWMPLTTIMDGEPVLVWDGDDSLIPTLLPIA